MIHSLDRSGSTGRRMISTVTTATGPLPPSRRVTDDGSVGFLAAITGASGYTTRGPRC